MPYYHDPNDAYFTKHLEKLVKAHGGKWVVIAGGRLIGVGGEEQLKKLAAWRASATPKIFLSWLQSPGVRSLSAFCNPALQAFLTASSSYSERFQ